MSDNPEPAAEPTRWRLSGIQIAVLVGALAFLAAAVGFVVGERGGAADPYNEVDIGFMQDMGYHHDQATEMSLMLLGKDDVDDSLKDFAREIIIGQRYEQGVYEASLDRFGFDTSPGDTVMGWMGLEQATGTMEGLASEAEMDELRAATGLEAEALWIALMSEHHLGGLHMADYAARHGEDRATVNWAEATVKNQRSEILDLARYRELNDIPIPEGYPDPTQDQRLDPISFTDPSD